MQFEDIKGLGVKRIQKLREAGLSAPSDLLTIFPAKYVVREDKLHDFALGDEARVVAVCQTEPVSKFIRRGLSFVRASFCDGKNTFDCVWFNQNYIKKQLEVGTEYALVGKIKRVGKRIDMYVSSFVKAEGGEIIPIYRAYNGIPAKVIKEAISATLDNVTVRGRISDELCELNGLMSFDRCIKAIHRPTSRAELSECRRHAALQILAYDLAVFSIYKGGNSRKRTNFYNDNVAALRKVMTSLPYELTEDQLSAIDSILRDMQSDRRMNRLIEGDVGCGKTVVAFFAMLFAALSGYQAALMAPTEILARQHYQKALEFFGPDIGCELLCGSQSAARRSEALFNIASGNAKIVFGTHSVFMDKVVFKNLALTIADEQQRFGVEQRGNFENKGSSTDSLVMSATPIPRTLALTLYGDLDISIIKTLPPKKAKIFTRVVPLSKERDMLDYIYKKSLEGEKSYVVCPRVEDEEQLSVTSMYETLHKRFGDVVGMVHGQMKDELKNRIMSAFTNGKIKILVCTTVIEVGIDVPDATNIIIYNAEMYGLSQLHQLRGRVGRGVKDSYCFVITKADKPDGRIEYFIKTNNGFELAEYDFKVRGAGDFLGKRQHGSDNIFSDVGISEEILSRAKTLSKQVIKYDMSEISGEETFEYIKGLTLN